MPAHGSSGIWPRDVLKKVSRGLSRVEAGHPGVPRLVQLTSGQLNKHVRSSCLPTGCVVLIWSPAGLLSQRYFHKKSSVF